MGDCVLYTWFFLYLPWFQKKQEQWWIGFLTLAEVCPSGVELILHSKCFSITHFTALYQIVKQTQNQTNYSVIIHARSFDHPTQAETSSL